MGESFARISPAKLEADFYTIDPLGDAFTAGQPLLSHGGDGALGNTYNAIWWRRPRALEDKLKLAFPLGEEIAGAEAYHAFRLPCEALPRSFFPLGHPVPMENAANKLLQLHLAKRVGFTVPETLVGNNPSAHGELLVRHERVVVKPLHANVVYDRENRGTAAQELR